MLLWVCGLFWLKSMGEGGVGLSSIGNEGNLRV